LGVSHRQGRRDHRVLVRVGERTAISPEPDLKILVRENGVDDKYLCLCNKNVENAVETTVTVKGKYSQAFDIIVPDWSPVPLEANSNETIVKVRLDPGDFTLILLKH
jgi:hypothetical protein